jgi:GTPase SAR1 family protein
MVYTIGLIGCVSSGKSSFVNAFMCGYVSSRSLQRETININEFPGLNDNLDKDNLLFNSIKHNIKNLNMIVYLTKIENTFIT